MSAKISDLNELRNILSQKEKTDEGVLTFSKQFKIGQLLKPFSAIKKQGYSLMSILLVLIPCCLSLHREYKKIKSVSDKIVEIFCLFFL